MIKILYVTHMPPDLSGSTLSLSYLVAHLDRQRYDPVLVFSERGTAANNFESLGTPMIYLKLAKYIHNASETLTPIRLRSWLLMLLSFSPDPRLASIARQYHIDLAHLNASVLVSAAITLQRMKIPIVWHVREVIPHGWFGIRRMLLTRAIARYADAIICISEDEAAPFVGNAKLHIIYNPVDLQRFEPAHTQPQDIRKEFDLAEDIVAIGFVASVAHHKGIWELVEAAERVVATASRPVKFMIVGAGKPSHRYPTGWRVRLQNRLGFYVDGLQELKAVLESKGLTQYFILTGERTDTPDVIAAMDIVTFPSRLSAIGRIAIEAGALGKPVVATDQEGRTGLIQNGQTGLLVPPRDPEHLASALLHLIEHPDEARRLGQNARTYAQSNFDATHHAQRVMEIYASLYQGRP